jgi:predicted dehydrogenase
LKCGNQDQAGKWWAQMEDFLLRDYAVHFLDLTRCFTGREPLRVKAVTGRKPGQVAVAPLLYSIALEYGPDAETVSTLHFNDLIPTNPATAHEEWWVDGTDESVLATHSQLTFVSRAAPQHQHVVSLQGGWYPDAFIGSIGEVMRSLSENRASEISADDNLYTLRLSQAALESSQTGEAVALPTRAER